MEGGVCRFIDGDIDSGRKEERASLYETRFEQGDWTVPALDTGWIYGHR